MSERRGERRRGWRQGRSGRLRFGRKGGREGAREGGRKGGRKAPRLPVPIGGLNDITSGQKLNCRQEEVTVALAGRISRKAIQGKLYFYDVTADGAKVS